MNIHHLATPAFLVDQALVQTNCAQMSRRAHKLGLRLRPHTKTHKTIEIARLQIEGHLGGITVSTLAEARLFSTNGFEDITYAVPITPDKLSECAWLARQIKKLNLIVDSQAMLEELERQSQLLDQVWSVFLKVDCGYHRAGVDPTSAEALQLARRLAGGRAIEFCGILTHAGHSYNAKDAAEAKQVAQQEVSVMRDFAKQLRNEGLACEEVSIGSTPTCTQLEEAIGISEMRPGNYVFYDSFQAAIGSCQLERVAVTVLATVMGHYPDRGEALIDAGALALSKDPGATHLDEKCGFGQVKGHPHLRLTGLSQEHGKLAGLNARDYQALPIGSKVRIYPNHSCLSSALFDRYHVIEGDQVVAEWEPIRGW